MRQASKTRMVKGSSNMGQPVTSIVRRNSENSSTNFNPHPLNQHRKAIRSAWFDNMITPRIQPLPTGRASSRAIRQSRTAQWSVGSGSPEQVRVWQRLVQLMRRKPGAPISKAELQQVPAEWRPGFLPARSTMRQRLTQALRKAGYHSPAKLSSSLPSRLAPIRKDISRTALERKLQEVA
jgi:hypothetical protein